MVFTLYGWFEFANIADSFKSFYKIISIKIEGPLLKTGCQEKKHF